jgi:hypothetical protein
VPFERADVDIGSTRQRLRSSDDLERKVTVRPVASSGTSRLTDWAGASRSCSLRRWDDGVPCGANSHIPALLDRFGSSSIANPRALSREGAKFDGLRCGFAAAGTACLEDPGEGWFEEAVGTAAEPQPERVLIGGAVEEEEELSPASASGGAWERLCMKGALRGWPCG